MKKSCKRTLKTFVTGIMLVALLLTCTTVALASETAVTDPDQLREEIATFASSDEFLGIPYVYGGTSKKGFDCSGFVQYVYAQFGITLERTTYYQKDMGTPVESKNDLLPGDLVFFRDYGHVGIYIGDGQFVHSSSGSGKVIISSLKPTSNSTYYSDHYSGARRIF